jgi:hypothetical protein
MKYIGNAKDFVRLVIMGVMMMIIIVQLAKKVISKKVPTAILNVRKDFLVLITILKRNVLKHVEKGFI